MPTILIALMTLILYKASLYCNQQKQKLFGGLGYVLCTFLIQITCNRALSYFVSDPYNYKIDFFNECYRIRKTFGAAFYCGVVCLIQYKFSEGFDQIYWFTFYLYEGCLIYRIYGCVENYIPNSLKPFPYFNIASSSNIVLWLIIGNEIGGISLTS